MATQRVAMGRWYDERIDPTMDRLGQLLAGPLGQLGQLPPRVRAYAPPLLALLLALAAAGAGVGPDAGRWRALGYLALFCVSASSSRLFRRGVDYHPIYAIERALESAAWFILAAQAWLGLAAEAAWLPWVWIGVLLASRVLALEFVIRRNRGAVMGANFDYRDRCWLWLARLALRGMSNEAARWLYETLRLGYLLGQG